MILSDNHQTKEVPKILYDELTINDKELLNKLKKYEVIHPEDVEPVANEFPEFYDKVNNFLQYILGAARPFCFFLRGYCFKVFSIYPTISIYRRFQIDLPASLVFSDISTVFLPARLANPPSPVRYAHIDSICLYIT